VEQPRNLHSVFSSPQSDLLMHWSPHIPSLDTVLLRDIGHGCVELGAEEENGIWSLGRGDDVLTCCIVKSSVFGPIAPTSACRAGRATCIGMGSESKRILDPILFLVEKLTIDARGEARVLDHLGERPSIEEAVKGLGPVTFGHERQVV